MCCGWAILQYMKVQHMWVIDLKVLVKSLYDEERPCSAGNHRESYFASLRKKLFLWQKFRESSMGILNLCIIIACITAC